MKARHTKPEKPPVSRSRDWAVAICIWLVFYAATLLLSDVDRTSEIPPGSGSPILYLARILILPFAFMEPSGVRNWVLPLALAVILLIAAFTPAPASRRATTETRRFPGDWWLEILAGLTVLLALVSAVVNHSWDMSRGWIFQLLCGCGWAIVLSRVATEISIRRMFIGGSVVALVGIVVSFWHRAVHHTEYFEWPIGPVTLTAGVGAIWVTVSIARLLASVTTGPEKGRVNYGDLILTAVVAVAAVALLIASERRGAWLGAVAGLAVAGGLVLWTRLARGTAQVVVVIVAIIGIALTAVYVKSQSHSSNPLTSIPLTIRYLYWNRVVHELPSAWLLGHGPDSFLCEMGTAIAPQRAAMPRLLHGNIDPETHNEWLQAAYEIGLPGAMVYLAIPLATLFLATKAWLADASRSRRTLLLSLVAGLAAVVVAEISSVNLRHPILSAWYWTMVGSAVALSRASVGAPLVAMTRVPAAVKRIAAIIASAALVWIVVGDIRASRAHVIGRLAAGKDNRLAANELAVAASRMGAREMVSARVALGNAELDVVRSLRPPAATQPGAAPPADRAADIHEWTERSLRTWKPLYECCPAYPGVSYRMAEAQMLAGEHAAACEVLDHYLEHVNPYESAANVLFQTLCRPPPAKMLESVERALRQGEWGSFLENHALAALKDPAVAAGWPSEVAQAQSMVVGQPVSQWADSAAPEILRIEAGRLLAARMPREAARMQIAAARAYDRMTSEHSPYCRSFFAEADAWQLAAQFVFYSDPPRYQEAFGYVRQAERAAVSAVPQVSVPENERSAEFVGGKVMPIETPDRLRSLWRFAAEMHLAMKSDPKLINMRVRWSLLPAEQTRDRITAELGNLAAELAGIFSHFDPAVRPPSYDGLIELARQYGPKRTPAPSGS